jgi:two-component system, response regulator, stage 0 sporulation protein F
MNEIKRIMIVDDERTILLSLSHLLKTEGVEVVTCLKIEEAEESLKRKHFDLIIADIRMSGMLGREGLELLNYVKQKDPSTRVVIMTAYGSPDIEKEAYSLGAYHYYNKPIDLVHLKQLVADSGIPVKN